MMRVPYDRRLESTDEQLAQLIAQRIHLSPGLSYPTPEHFERWAAAYHVDRHILASTFAVMNNPHRPPRLPISPQDLITVIPVMQKVTCEDVPYQITRMEQYADGSVIYVDIFTREESDTADLTVQLLLTVEPAEGRHVELHRAEARANQASMAYLVRPSLSDDVASYQFALAPYVHPHRHSRPVERILDQPVLFAHDARGQS